MIDARGIAHTIGGVQVLAPMDIRIERGQHTLVAGASGSGKTTLLHILAGLLQPTQGQVNYNGEAVVCSDAWRAAHVGFVFQTLHLMPALTIAQNIQLAGYCAGKKVEATRIQALLDAVGLQGLGSRTPQALSHGQAQRASIARALANAPALIFADEPTSALDDANTHAVMSLLMAQAEAHGATLVVATHDARITHHFSHTIRL